MNLVFFSVQQVKRLIAVLSIPGVSRRKLLEGTSLDPGPDVTLQERKQLEAAGWAPGTTIRSLLNFSGETSFGQLDLLQLLSHTVTIALPLFMFTAVSCMQRHKSLSCLALASVSLNAISGHMWICPPTHPSYCR